MSRLQVRLVCIASEDLLETGYFRPNRQEEWGDKVIDQLHLDIDQNLDSRGVVTIIEISLKQGDRVEKLTLIWDLDAKSMMVADSLN
jgi:hypothetical protein